VFQKKKAFVLDEVMSVIIEVWKNKLIV
jgi:hypothetical protein